MTGQEIVAKVQSLKLPKNSYIVFGSCPMALAGIRESQDIDMLVDQATFDSFAQAGWQEVVKSSRDKPLTHEEFEAHHSWNFSSYKPTLGQLLATATVVDGIPFASLQEVRKWKQSSGRPKDLKDIALIDAYLAKNHRL
jgi:hypothetical protein